MGPVILSTPTPGLEPPTGLRTRYSAGSRVRSSTWGRRMMSSPPGETVFLRSPLMSHTRTVWSRLALTTCARLRA